MDYQTLMVVSATADLSKYLAQQWYVSATMLLLTDSHVSYPLNCHNRNEYLLEIAYTD